MSAELEACMLQGECLLFVPDCPMLLKVAHAGQGCPAAVACCFFLSLPACACYLDRFDGLLQASPGTMRA